MTYPFLCCFSCLRHQAVRVEYVDHDDLDGPWNDSGKFDIHTSLAPLEQPRHQLLLWERLQNLIFGPCLPHDCLGQQTLAVKSACQRQRPIECTRVRRSGWAACRIYRHTWPKTNFCGTSRLKSVIATQIDQNAKA